MKDLIIKTTCGYILFGFVLYFSAAGYLGLFDDLNYKPTNDFSNSVLSASITKSDFISKEIKSDISKSVYLPINLNFMGAKYIFNSGHIETVLGNRTEAENAITYLEEYGDEKLEYILNELLNADLYNKKLFQVNKNGIMRERIEGYDYYEQEFGPDVSGLKSMIHDILVARLKENFGIKEYLNVESIRHMGTNGEFTSEKYLEFDHSSQTMYAWENGELFKKWSGSGFTDDYAVFGVFEIQNKSVNAWSNFAEKWMPYWMAYYYDPIQKINFGVHELVYWYDSWGNRLEESSNSIGNKKSGGCIRLDRGEMVVLYEWSEVDMPFLVHE